MRFFKSRITLEAAYYNTLCTKQISQGYRASYATTAVLNTTNSSSLRNEGVELTLNLTPVKKKNFNWTVNFNFSHMWSKVLTLPESIGPFNDYYNSDDDIRWEADVDYEMKADGLYTLTGKKADGNDKREKTNNTRRKNSSVPS